MSLRLYILTGVQCFALCLSALGEGAENDFDALKQKFLNNNELFSQSGKAALLEMATGNYGDDAYRFLMRIYSGPAETRGGLHAHFPEEDLKLSQEMRGVAQAALIALGDHKAKEALLDELGHKEKFIRSNALEKARMISGDEAIEILSLFLGDDTDSMDKPVGPLEWGAAIELSSRLENPPYNFKDMYHTEGYRSGGRTAWLKWRYENYGPIPGREELFTQFAASSGEGNPATPSARVVESVEENTAPEPAIEEPTKVVVAEPIEEDVEQSSNWWLWLIGAVAVVAGVGLAVRRKS